MGTMYRPITLGLVLASVAASGCRSEPSPDPERRGARGTGAADSAAVAADPHAGHAMADPAAGTPDAGGEMVGMDHGPTAAAGSADAAVDHSGHAPAASAASPTAPRASAADHAGHQQPARSVERSRAAATEHAGHAAPPAAGRGAGSSATGAHAAADHARTQGDPHHAPAPGDPHAEHAPTPGDPPRTLPDAGMQKLLTLVAELVQDSVVQRRIEMDPALRQLWREPGVRRILLPRRD